MQTEITFDLFIKKKPWKEKQKSHECNTAYIWKTANIIAKDEKHDKSPYFHHLGSTESPRQESDKKNREMAEKIKQEESFLFA